MEGFKDEPSRTFRQESFSIYLPFGFLFSALRCRLQDLKGSAFSIVGHRLFPVLRNHRHHPFLWFYCRSNPCDCSTANDTTVFVTDCIVRDKHIGTLRAGLRSECAYQIDRSVLRVRQAGYGTVGTLVHYDSVYFADCFAGLGSAGQSCRSARLLRGRNCFRPKR